ncbi:MAG: hypothetical protein JO048_18195, partial [Methylobacteriaceae bacterium]|nr:hypothetical protein [Methylobacteriaceae bacterium]
MSETTQSGTGEHVERLRIQLGAWIVIAAIVAVILSLLAIVSADKVATVSDKVALLGAITTFLGTTVGIFFGITAGGTNSGHAAASAAENSRAAGKIADATQTVAKANQTVSDSIRSFTGSFASPGIERAAASFAADPRSFAGIDRAALAADPATDDVELLSGDPDEEPASADFSTAAAAGLALFTSGPVHVASPVPPTVLFQHWVLAA